MRRSKIPKDIKLFPVVEDVMSRKKRIAKLKIIYSLDQFVIDEDNRTVEEYKKMVRRIKKLLKVFI